jgi:hypothetical protein
MHMHRRIKSGYFYNNGSDLYHANHDGEDIAIWVPALQKNGAIGNVDVEKMDLAIHSPSLSLVINDNMCVADTLQTVAFRFHIYTICGALQLFLRPQFFMEPT